MSGPATSRSVEPSTGFPNSGLSSAIPNQFFSTILPQIEAAEELVVSFYFFFAQHLRRRSPRFLTKRELAADTTLARSLAHLGPGDDALDRGLDLAVWRGTLLRARAQSGGRPVSRRPGHAACRLRRMPADRLQRPDGDLRDFRHRRQRPAHDQQPALDPHAASARPRAGDADTARRRRPQSSWRDDFGRGSDFDNIGRCELRTGVMEK